MNCVIIQKYGWLGCEPMVEGNWYALRFDLWNNNRCFFGSLGLVPNGCPFCQPSCPTSALEVAKILKSMVLRSKARCRVWPTGFASQNELFGLP